MAESKHHLFKNQTRKGGPPQKKIESESGQHTRGIPPARCRLCEILSHASRSWGDLSLTPERAKRKLRAATGRNPKSVRILSVKVRKASLIAIAMLLVLLAGCKLSPRSVLTQHNNSMRTGACLLEKQLSPAAVDTASGPGMMLRYWRPVDGNLTSQLLYARGVWIGWKRRSVIYAHTDKNIVYAYDADEERDPGTNRGLFWSRSLPVTPNPSLPANGGNLATPVIDRSCGKLYLVYAISNGLFPPGGQGDGNPLYEVEYHLAALDLSSGNVLQDIVISGSVSSSVPPGYADFVPRRVIQRAGLLLSRNPLAHGEHTVYVAFASRWHEETHNYHGWVMGYDAKTFAPRGVFCSTPDRRLNSEGGGIWQGGGGLAGDEDGNVYFNTGNGPGSGNDHGNSIVKLTPVLRAGKYDFNVQAFSAAADDPAHATEWANNDIDLGGGGVTVIPDSSRLVSGGKTGVLYLMDRSAMTKVLSFEAFSVNPADDPDPLGARYRDWGSGPHLHGAWTYWQVSATRGYVYHWGEKDFLKRFDYDRTTGQINPASVVSGDVLAKPFPVMPGGLISLSANGTKDGLLWITLPWDGGTGRVMAYDALTLRRLWDTTVPATGASHNGPPTVADGKVVVGTNNGNFLVYGLATPHFIPPVYARREQMLPMPPDPGPWIREYLGGLGPEKAAAVTPPKGHRALFLALGKGTLTYEAKRVEGTTSPQWVLVGVSGDLRDDSGVLPHMAYQGLGEVLATAEQGLTWKTQEGGLVRWSVESSVDAPQTRDAPWVLFRARGRDGRGLLSYVTYFQLLGTAGGARPGGVAQMGRRLQVPYTGRYAFYVAEGVTQGTSKATR